MAREIFRRKPSVKRALWGGEFWTDGYYVATVGEGGGWEVIERYVRNQGRLKEELRQLKLFKYPALLARGCLFIYRGQH